LPDSGGVGCLTFVGKTTDLRGLRALSFLPPVAYTCMPVGYHPADMLNQMEVAERARMIFLPVRFFISNRNKKTFYEVQNPLSGSAARFCRACHLPKEG
jgi:hypothetical protein